MTVLIFELKSPGLNEAGAFFYFIRKRFGPS